MPSRPRRPPTGFDDDHLFVEVRFGEGGDDARSFVYDLAQAYQAHARRCGLTAVITTQVPGHVVLEVRGRGARDAFAGESGLHVCQRVPSSSRSGRRHTSCVRVGILGRRPEGRQAELDPEAVEITAQRGRQSAGGQKVNKTSSAIRAVHAPSGITVFAQGERSQAQNRKEALRLLSLRVNAKVHAREAMDYDRHRRAAIGDGSRGGKVRTYNFIESRVTDHRNGQKTRQIEAVMAGRFDLVA